jgi:predicted DNA-binding protein (UPF0251 family)
VEQPLRVQSIDLQHPAGDVVEEVAVVADHDERLRLVDQESLEPEDGVDVEVIGRLVEQQDVG